MLLSKIKKKIGVRQLRVYCLGAAKTGTTSFAGMFAENYRSEHEPNVPDLTSHVINYHKGKLSAQECKAWLLARDKSLNLDVEASHPLGYMAPLLADIYPEAKFVITYREPLAWLRSRLDFHKIVQPTDWKVYRDYIWAKGHQGYDAEESILEKNGLYSLDAYLSQYAEQYKILFESLPEERTLVIKTNELNNSKLALANFLDIAESNIEIKHMNKVDEKLNILDEINGEYVTAKINKHCTEVMSLMKKNNIINNSLIKTS